MSDEKWTKANRRTEVIGHIMRQEKIGSFSGYSKGMLDSFGDEFKSLEDGDNIWVVGMTTRAGLGKEDIGVTIYATEGAAKEAVRSVLVGTVWGEDFGLPMRFKELCELNSSSRAKRLIPAMFLPGDEEAVYFTCYEALSKVGVISEKTYEISQRTLDWLGDEHVGWMKTEFGENCRQWESLSIA